MAKKGSRFSLVILLTIVALLAVSRHTAIPVKADPGWQIEIVDSSAADVGKYSSLTLDSNGYPHISYYDDSNGNLKYASYNGTTWNIQTVDSSGDVGLYTSLVLDSNDYPRISYYGNSDLKYARYNGTTWNIQTVDSIDNVGLYTSLELDSDGHPNISYFYEKRDGLTLLDYYLRYARYDGADWNIENVAHTVAWWTSLALDSDDHPRISYYNNGLPQNLMYASYNGTDWNKETVDDLTVGAIGLYTSLVLDSNDYPHISYYHHEYGNLKYASYNGTDWNTEEVDNPGNVGLYTSMALDGNGYPRISYHALTNGDLKYASYNGTDWNIETVDSAGDVGEYSSLTLDPNGYPHISYYDSIEIIEPTEGRLKYARAVPPPGLAVSKDGTSIAQVGDNITYWVAISNAGGIPLQKVSISDNRSGVVTDISGLFSAILPVGASENRTYTYVAEVGDPNPLINTVTAVYTATSFPDLSQSDSHSVTLLHPSINVTKMPDNSISKVGDNITYTITIENTGDCTLIRDSVSDNLSVSPDPNTYAPFATIPASSSVSGNFSYTVQATDPDPLGNIVTINYHPEGLPNNISDNATCTVDLVHPGLSISKSADNTISKVTDTITYTYTINNTGDVELLRNIVMDVISGRIINLTSSFPSSLAAGASANVTYPYTVQPGDGDPLENIITAHYYVDTLPNDIQATASHSVDLVSPNILVTKGVAAGAYGAGDNITYLVSISNTSTDITLVKNTVTDSLAGDIASLFGYTIAPGGSDNHTYTYTVKETDPDPLENLVTAHYHPQGLPNDITDNTTASVFLAPTITSVAPNQGNQTQTLNVTITGLHLSRVNAVDFGAGITVNSSTVDSPTQITANISINAAAAPGPRNVIVTNPVGSDTLTGGFTVQQPAQSVATATGTGTATFATSNGSVTNFTALSQSQLTCSDNPGVKFPQGFFSFNITGIAPGSTVTITATLPSNIPVGTQYWKCQNGQWVNVTSLLGDNDGDNVLTLTITDGGLGDADGQANGIIVDPGGPGIGGGATFQVPAEGASTGDAHSTSLRSPRMNVANITISTGMAKVNQQVTIIANVTNDGDMTGSTKVALKINGTVEQTKLVTLGPGGSSPVKFTVTKAEPGTYTAIIGSQRASFMVADGHKSTAPAIDGTGIAIMLLSALVVAIIGVLILAFRRPTY